MIKGPAFSSLEHRNSSVYLKGEFLLLIFIIIFGLIGIGLCFGLSDKGGPEETGMKDPTILVENL